MCTTKFPFKPQFWGTSHAKFQTTDVSHFFHAHRKLIGVLLLYSSPLQERTGLSAFTDRSWTLKYRLDNEFDLVFVVGFQKILQLSYVDKLLDDVQREFRDKFENLLTESNYYQVRLRLALEAALTSTLYEPSAASYWTAYMCIMHIHRPFAM